MNEQAKQLRREYKRAWNKRNPDKVRQYQENYWNRKAEAMKQADEPKQEA